MHRVAMPPQWRPDRSDAGPSRALLLPELLARAGNFPAALGFVRAGALRGAVMFHRFPQQIFVDRAENLVGQVERPDLLAAQIVYIDRRHICSRSGGRIRPHCLLTPSSPPSSPPSTDPPSPNPQIRAVLVAASSLW